VREGLLRLSDCAWVIVHDGARPFVHPSLIEDGLAAARQTGAAIAAMPVRDTIKLVGAAGLVEQTLDRSRLWQVQTPQVFRFDRLLSAHLATDVEVTDDAALLERQGWPIAVFPDSYDNIKITTTDDLTLAECLLRRGQ
jgi:2-C-methyl-D-erythritol 4-phosphate cytidylyltransferase